MWEQYSSGKIYMSKNDLNKSILKTAKIHLPMTMAGYIGLRKLLMFIIYDSRNQAPLMCDYQYLFNGWQGILNILKNM